jgi:hypothetical protein
MKITMFEDLIADLYARLYEINIPHLVEQATAENKEKMKLDNLLMTGEGVESSNTPPTSAPASETPAPRGRTKGIARRDIQKRADTIVNTKLAPRAVASKVSAAGETDPSVTLQAGSGADAGPVSAPRSGKEGADNGDGAEQTADEDDMSEMEETKIGEEGTSVLFPAVTDAEEGATGDEGMDDGDGEGEDEEDGHENENDGEGEEGDGDGHGDGEQGGSEGEGEGDEDEDEEMQDEETKLEEDDKEEKDVPTADQSANDTETEVVTGKQDAGEQDAMDITSS